MIRSHLILFTALIILTSACEQRKSEDIKSLNDSNSWFVKMPSGETGLTFTNQIVEDQNQNVLLYEYFYNGGGVAIGDYNNDGKEDVFLTSSQQSCKLYLNKGAWSFKDVTSTSGVSGRSSDWKTGAVAVDINADGWLDIYLCYSGPFAKDRRTNQLFINKGIDASGNLIFKDEAKSFGLDDPGFTTHAAFFDYDHDGDLDAILINHNPRRPENLTPAIIQEMTSNTSAMKGVRLYRNDNNTFVDATLQSGIQNSELNFGLGVAISDINSDGWSDIYLSNDYLAPDYLYLNNGDGTFSDKTTSSLRHMAHFSMGNSIGDVNNDTRPDIITLDMLPEDNRRQKLLFAPDNYNVFDLHQELGLHAQFMRNMLQLNNGDGTFSEVGQLSGISNTDWSWAPLLADFDNDGWKDLYVTNGYLRDFTNMDFLKYMTKYFESSKATVKKEDLINVVEKMPSSNVRDYLFKNEGGITFSDKSISWGITEQSNGNGAAYADFDNDGDLDLIINTINSFPTVYRNDAGKYSGNKSITIKLSGEGSNRMGAGAKLFSWCNGKVQLHEQNSSVGFQSSVSPNIIVGVGRNGKVDSLKIVWSGGKAQTLYDIRIGKEIILEEKEASTPIKRTNKENLKHIFTETKFIDFRHVENKVNDFKRQPLMTMAQSFNGPCLAVGDVDADGKNDLYIGGAVGQSGTILIQNKLGQYSQTNQQSFETDKTKEDTDAIFFDADNDGDVDLYVCSGGYDLFQPDDKQLQDRLYVNDGHGNFLKKETALPSMRVSSSCVRYADINKDGYTDLFVGGRVVPGRFPEVPRSYVLFNDGKGKFNDATSLVNKSLEYPGLITDAQWTDLNSDGWSDLITVGEWMPIQIWINDKGKLTDKTQEYLPKEYTGWWNALEVADLNNDGRLDMIVGNHGLNSQCKASDAQPAELYARDFDANGSLDPIFCFFIQGKSYPYVSRDELLEQLASKRKKFTDYESYANAQLDQIFTPEELKDAIHKSANTFETKVFIADSSGRFKEISIPTEAQYSPVHSIVTHDFNNDGTMDLLLAGNDKNGRLRLGWYDANYGFLFTQDRLGKFNYVPQYQSGLSLKGDIRSMKIINNQLIIGINNDAVKTYSFSSRPNQK